MSQILSRASFTARLLALTIAVMAALVIIDYVALLEVPSRIARDTVEIALRENVQALNSTFRESRLELGAETDEFVQGSGQEEVTTAILERDRDRLEELLAESVDTGIDFRFMDRSAIDGSGIGPIWAHFNIQGRGETSDIVFFRRVDDDVLDRAAVATSEAAAFALEFDGRFVATSDAFPATIDPGETGTSIDPNVAELTEISVDGQDLHIYSRAVTSDASYQLHALSTPELEEAALSEIRDDVRTAIAGMTIATVAAFLLLIFFTNRTVRSFATRVRTLADGDYGTRLGVRGHDAFAELASSVNRLSEQLEDQVGQLEDTARAFGRTLETLEEGICVWDEQGHVSFWNRGAEQLTGLARERARLEDPVVSFLRAERAPGTRRVTLPVRRAGGGLVVDLVVTSMPGGGVVQTFRDTTMADLLQQTQRNFMATAAHELRTPITTILGFADTLVNPELELTERQREEFISIIRDHAYDLQEISDAFFTNHQLANERVEVSIVPSSLADVVADGLQRVRATMPEREAEFDDVQVDVPAEAVVLADRRALVGVVGVLVENAFKYGAPPVSITAERSGGTMTLLVRDFGPGIESHHHARLFDPFYRIDVDMRSGVGGAGLGLFTARKLVEAMHGSIRVLSSPESGTTFVVDLPMAPGDHSEGDSSRLRLVG